MLKKNVQSCTQQFEDDDNFGKSDKSWYCEKWKSLFTGVEITP